MRVLIASAETAFCREIQTLLDSVEGITTIEEQESELIVDRIPELQPDLVLLDLDSGTSIPRDIVSTISRRHPAVRILVLSAPGEEQRVLDALRSGAHGHLTKGVSDREHLVAALRAIGRGESVLSPVMAGAILDELSHRYQRFRGARTLPVVQAGSAGAVSGQKVTE
jgi:DNA-binding NarL/FixJ family response regulator